MLGLPLLTNDISLSSITSPYDLVEEICPPLVKVSLCKFHVVNAVSLGTAKEFQVFRSCLDWNLRSERWWSWPNSIPGRGDLPFRDDNHCTEIRHSFADARTQTAKQTQRLLWRHRCPRVRCLCNEPVQELALNLKGNRLENSLPFLFLILQYLLGASQHKISLKFELKAFDGLAKPSLLTSFLEQKHR